MKKGLVKQSQKFYEEKLEEEKENKVNEIIRQRIADVLEVRNEWTKFLQCLFKNHRFHTFSILYFFRSRWNDPNGHSKACI